MCDIWKREERTEIKVAALQRHRASLQQLGVRWVVLSGGEPLLHSDLRSLCSFFRELGIRLTLLTTGLLLTKRAAEVSKWFDDVIVSLDGPAAIHDSIRNVHGAYKLIAAGISAIRQRRPEINISARTTVQKANHAHLCETVEAAKALGMSSVSFLAADLTSEAFNRPLLWPVERQSSIALTREEIPTLAKQVESLIADYRAEIASGYIAESPAKLRIFRRTWDSPNTVRRSATLPGSPR
jgi:MoaA/NifB/PqqE/SkfB family radical SAM enzyme